MEAFKQLQDESLGCVITLPKNQIVYYKPHPIEEKKELILFILSTKKATWERYKAAFAEETP